MGTWGERARGATSRAKKELCVSTSKEKGSPRRVFPRGAATAPDVAKPRGNGLFLTPNSQAHTSDLGSSDTEGDREAKWPRVN